MAGIHGNIYPHIIISPIPVKKVFLCIFAFILHTIFILACKTVSYKFSLRE